MRQYLSLRGSVHDMDDEVRRRVGAGEDPRGKQLRSADNRPHSAAMPGNTAIVTGGASGIGLGIAEAFLDRGMNVVMADVRDDHLAHAQDHLRRHGSRLMPRRLDVTESMPGSMPSRRPATVSAPSTSSA
ncbi:hypothetical protein SGRIM119S_02542 [Streptomyces griseorubiginosus]